MCVHNFQRDPSRKHGNPGALPSALMGAERGVKRMCNRKFRPDLSDYEIFIMALVDKLNEESVYKMSKTDAVKFAVEKAVKTILPDIEIKPKRKRYVTLKF